jgi:hypothetical protein
VDHDHAGPWSRGRGQREEVRQLDLGHGDMLACADYRRSRMNDGGAQHGC